MSNLTPVADLCLVYIPSDKVLLDRHLVTEAQAEDAVILLAGDQLLNIEVEGLVYLSGPMSGMAEFNIPAFNAAAAKLRADGLSVYNPGECGLINGADWGHYMRYNLAQLQRCTSIALLPGWSRSRGAKLEKLIAESLGMEISFLDGAERDEAAKAA